MKDEDISYHVNPKDFIDAKVSIESLRVVVKCMSHSKVLVGIH